MCVIIDPSIRDEITKSLSVLPYEKQQRVLEFILFLTELDHRTKGDELIRFVGAIEKDNLKIMEQEIEESCERIDLSEW